MLFLTSNSVSKCQFEDRNPRMHSMSIIMAASFAVKCHGRRGGSVRDAGREKSTRVPASSLKHGKEL